MRGNRVKNLRYSNRDRNTVGVFGCMVTVMILNVILGGVSFHYCLWSIFGKDIPWYGDAVFGLFAGEVTIPLAVVVWILRLFIQAPFF